METATQVKSEETEVNKELQQVNSDVVTPVQLLQIAVTKGADLDQMERLMALQERWEANEAKKAYHHAVAEFKKESINIIKNKRVSFDISTGGKAEYSHATLDHILDLAVPVLASYGLSHHWDTEQGDGGRITVTCHLTHASGHSNSVALVASPDDSGKKNNIQRIASTVSYLERYTFLAITGLAAKDQDDDGISAGERFDKKAFDEGKTAGCEMGKLWYEHREVIETVKDRLADDDYLAAAEALYSLSNQEMAAMNRAPTKGGIFTMEEAKKMSSQEWKAVVPDAIKLNDPELRSM